MRLLPFLTHLKNKSKYETKSPYPISVSMVVDVPGARMVAVVKSRGWFTGQWFDSIGLRWGIPALRNDLRHKTFFNLYHRYTHFFVVVVCFFICFLLLLLMLLFWCFFLFGSLVGWFCLVTAYDNSNMKNNKLNKIPHKIIEKDVSLFVCIMDTENVRLTAHSEYTYTKIEWQRKQ